MQEHVHYERRRMIANLGPLRSVHRPSNYGTKPHSIYFYYVTPVSGGQLSATPGFFEDPVAEITYRRLKQRVATLAEEARNGELTPPPDECEGVDRCWVRRSWLVYVLSDPALRFTDDAIEVRPGPNRAYNHAFFDGRSFPVMAGGHLLSATACINHLYINEHRDDLLVPGDYQDFDIRLYYQRLTITATMKVLGPVEYSDTGGTNMGPPVPPPAYLDN